MTTTPHSIYRNFTFDRAIPTHYDSIYVWQQARGVWRTLVTDESGDTDTTGVCYRTKSEALANLDAIRAAWF